MTQADFHKFKHPVARQFEKMSKHPMFRVDIDKDVLWSTYLSAYPEGSNNIFRKRPEHDCSCCRGFIRSVGNAVAVIDGELVSLWDVSTDDPAFQAVADAMSALVKSRPIDNVFLSKESVAGTDKTFEQLVGGEVRRWTHFFVNVPAALVRKGVEIGPLLAESRASHDVFYRSLQELTLDSVDTVLELVAQNSLYRGEEHKHTLEKFRALKREYAKLPLGREQHTFVWSKLAELPGSVSRIRNTSITRYAEDGRGGQTETD
jgi:hypothetical protein